MKLVDHVGRWTIVASAVVIILYFMIWFLNYLSQ